jgi:hypothetical protein
LWLGAFLLIAGALVYGIRDILMNQERPSPVAAVTAHQPPAPPPIPPQSGDAPEKSIGTRDNQGRPLPVPEPDHLGGGILQ